MTDNKDLFDFLEKMYELRINNQSAAIDSIEAKSGQILTGIGIFLPIALTLLANNQFIKFNDWIYVGSITSLIAILISGYVMWAKFFHIRPKISKFYDDTRLLAPNKMRMEGILDMNKAIEDNDRSHRWTVVAFNTTIVLFCASILLISYGILEQQHNLTYTTTKKHSEKSYARPKRQPKSTKESKQYQQ